MKTKTALPYMSLANYDALIRRSVGGKFRLETHEGVTRVGKITGIVTKKFQINGSLVEFPFDLEINGDPTDRVPFDRIKRLELL